MEISNNPDREFKILIINILTELETRVEKSVKPLIEKIKNN